MPHHLTHPKALRLLREHRDHAQRMAKHRKLLISAKAQGRADAYTTAIGVLNRLKERD